MLFSGVKYNTFPSQLEMYVIYSTWKRIQSLYVYSPVYKIIYFQVGFNKTNNSIEVDCR